MPASPRLEFSITELLNALTEARAKKDGVTKSEVGRRALAAYLGAEVPDMPIGLAGADAETRAAVSAEGGVASGRKKRVKAKKRK